MEISHAYWINPQGEIFSVSRHIQFMLSNLKMFKLTLNQYQETFKKYNEKIGLEAKAREELIVNALKLGWCKIREYPNEGWSLEIWELNENTKKSIASWAVELDKALKDNSSFFYNKTNVSISIHKLIKERKPQSDWLVTTTLIQILKKKNI